MSTWKVDPAHTDVTFSVKHMMVTTVRGKFDEVEDELELDLDGEDASTAAGEIRLGVASLSTGSEPRDAHLRSGDFFDAEQFPYVTARITGIEPDGSSPVSFPMEHLDDAGLGVDVVGEQVECFGVAQPGPI